MLSVVWNLLEIDFLENASLHTKKRHCNVGCKTSLQHNSTDLINLLTLFCSVSCCTLSLRRCQMDCTCTHLAIWLAEAFGKRPKSRFYSSVTFRWWRTTPSFFVWNNNRFCYIIRHKDSLKNALTCLQKWENQVFGNRFWRKRTIHWLTWACLAWIDLETLQLDFSSTFLCYLDRFLSLSYQFRVIYYT